MTLGGRQPIAADASDGDGATGGLVAYMPQDVGLRDGDRTARELLLSLAPSAVRRTGESMMELERSLTGGDDDGSMLALPTYEAALEALTDPAGAADVSLAKRI